MSLFDLSQMAYFRGFPFHPLSCEIKVGRKTHTHEYADRDGVYVEDLGRKGRQYVMQGRLVGDGAEDLAQGLRLVCEVPGPGVLFHPSIGARNVACIDCSFSQDEKRRSVNVSLQFAETADSPLFEIINDTVSAIHFAVSSFMGLIGNSFYYNSNRVLTGRGNTPVNIASNITSQVQVRTRNATSVIRGLAADATTGVNTVVGLSALLDSNSPITLGRYSGGNLSKAPAVLSGIDRNSDVNTRLAAGTSLLLTTAHDNLVQVKRNATLTEFSAGGIDQAASNAFAGYVTSLCESLRNTVFDPNDQVSTLSQFASDSALRMPLPNVAPNAGDYTAAMFRQAALASLANSLAEYQPLSSTEANEMLARVVPLFDAEIQFCGDNFDDISFSALNLIRSRIIEDLETRGASLPELITVTRKGSLPGVVIAYQLYGSALREDELVRRVNPMHPGFFPAQFEALSR